MSADPSGTTATWVVHRDDVGNLVAKIFDQRRGLPIILVSVASDTGAPRLDPQLLQGRVRAHVAVLESVAVADALSHSVGEAFRAFGGAVRVIWPQATSRDHWRRHRLFHTYADDDPQATADHIAAYISDNRAVLAPAPKPVPRIDGITPAVLDRKAHVAPAPTPGPVPTASPTPAPVPTAPPRPAAPPQPTPARVDLTSVESRLEALERIVAGLPRALADSVRGDVADVIHELVGGGGSDEVDRERSRADAAEQELDALRRSHERTLRELADSRHAATPAAVWSDPARQLRHEIEQAWLLATPEERREGGPRGFRFGPRFLDSLRAEIIPRAKAVLMCAEVLNRTIHTRRTTHHVEDGVGSGRHRSRADASACWRAYLKSNSPGAPRLMWWELKDGTVEFALAAHHDDLTFP